MAAVFEKYTTGGHGVASWSHALSNQGNRWIVLFATYHHASTPTPATGATFDGNSMTQRGSNLTSPDTEIKASMNVWTYQVPAAMSGTKTVAFTGGGSIANGYAIEISGCSGYGQIGSTSGDDANLTLNSCGIGSICLDMLIADNAITPSVDEGNTFIHGGNYDSADNRYDYGWGVSREDAPGGGGNVTMGWNATTSTRCYFMIEMDAVSFGGGVTVFMLERWKRFYEELKRGLLHPDILKRRYEELLI